MKKGKIQTNCGDELEVFYLKDTEGKKCSGGEPFSPHSHDPNTWIVNDEETAKALYEDNVDHCQDLKDEMDKDAPGCCPTGHKGEQGVKGEPFEKKLSEEIHPLQQDFAMKKHEALHKFLKKEHEEGLATNWPTNPPEAYDISDDHLSKLFKMTFGKMLKKEIPLPVQIDDTIESDFVKEPVIGEIYRVKGLNVTAKYVGKVQTVNESIFRQMRYHTHPFFLLDTDKMLLKTTEFERELYLNFKL